MDVVNEEYFFLKLARREFEPSSPSIIHKDYWLNLGTCRKICESQYAPLLLSLSLSLHHRSNSTEIDLTTTPPMIILDYLVLTRPSLLCSN